jgi:hypothetical protein
VSLEAMTWALGVDVGDATRKLVLIGYANHAHKDGRNSWASKETIAEYANCSKRTVQRHVDALIASGWMRRGDQRQVAHLRADRRPVVYDVAMSEAERAAWEASETSTRGDNLTPRVGGDETATGGQPDVTPPDVHGVTDGVTQPCPPRGDTAVSPEPSLNKGTTPQPPASGGRACAKPGPTPHVNCRGCGTTNRQIEVAAKQSTEFARRRDEQERYRREREAAEATRVATEDLTGHLADAIARARQTLARSRR